METDIVAARRQTAARMLVANAMKSTSSSSVGLLFASPPSIQLRVENVPGKYTSSVSAMISTSGMDSI